MPGPAKRQTPLAPLPGRPVSRGGKPWIYVTWLAKLLGGDQCVRRVWFMSRFKHAKLPERDADKLQDWNREHNEMMRERRILLEENGYRCLSEHEIRIEGKTAVIAGKEDLVAQLGDHTLIVDGKTGKRRDSDVQQVLLYLYMRMHQPRAEGQTLQGEVFYKSGPAIDIHPDHVHRNSDSIVRMVQLIADPAEPTANPSRFECQRCSIRREDCPDRWGEEHAVETVVETGAF